VIGLAKETCPHCLGYGMRKANYSGALSPCGCVLRAVFRACYRRFRYLVTQEKHISQARCEHTDGKEGRLAWGRKEEEFIADFSIVAKRILSAEEYKLFRFHFLLGADWKLCCRQMKMDRGDFFYSLYPLDEYFGGAVRGAAPARTPTVFEMPILKRRRLDPPLRKVA